MTVFLAFKFRTGLYVDFGGSRRLPRAIIEIQLEKLKKQRYNKLVGMQIRLHVRVHQTIN
jgi:hypothetical protein